VGGNGCSCDHAINWKGKEWTPTPRSRLPPQRPLHRAGAQCRHLPDWEDPAGVPIDIFIFGGRRSTTVPSCTRLSISTTCLLGRVGVVRDHRGGPGRGPKTSRDPFAMTPFIGYHAGDYIQHWFEMGKKLGTRPLPSSM